MRSPYWLFLVLLLLLDGLQYRLWVGNGSLAQVADLKQQIADQHAENERLLERNRVLDAEVLELKKGMETSKNALVMSWVWSRRVKPSTSWPNDGVPACLLGSDSCRGCWCPHGGRPSQAVPATGRADDSRA
ncbi:cell division protein FtsB [compost metagenome]